MISVRTVSKTYRRGVDVIDALIRVSMDVADGQFVVVRGPSGCGKTTLLLAAGALLMPDEGTVILAGQDPYALTNEQRAALRARTVGFVFQQFHLVPYLTVAENVLTASLATAQPGSRTRCDELLERFNMSGRRDHLPGELSTGEKQRTALARALLNGPKILLADEPTGNLDEVNEQIVLETFKAFAADGGAVLMVTHDPHWETYADRTIHLKDGQVVG